MRRRVESIESLRKIKCMNSYRNNISSFLKIGKLKNNKKWKEKLCRRKTHAISNYMRRNTERRLKIRNNSNKKLILLKDYNPRWIKKDKCFLRREDKRRNISKKCWLKTKDKRPKLPLKEKKRDKRIFRHRKNILEC